MKYIIIANAFAVAINEAESTKPVKYILSEYSHIISDSSETYPVIGSVSGNKVSLPETAIELRKNYLYEHENDTYIHSGNTNIKINAKTEKFEIEVDAKSDCEIAFFTVEMLIRMYAPKYGVIFMHTAAFRYMDKICTINAFGGVGKTEVMLKALEKGAEFLSDDFAIYNSKGQVFPYSKRIYLCEYPYDDWMLKLTGKSKALWKLKQWCVKHPNPITTRLNSRLEINYFGIKIDYRTATPIETENKFYDVDYFFWVDNSNKTDFHNIDKSYFEKRMLLCLDIESRRYCDYDGYLRLKYPFLNDYKDKQTKILNQITENTNIQGLTIRDHQFSELANLVLSNIG